MSACSTSQSIELLPGPQGTLYGRAALGGAVNVEFNRPTQELETSGVLEVGDYSLLHGTIVQNLPVQRARWRCAARSTTSSTTVTWRRARTRSRTTQAGCRRSTSRPTTLDVYVWVHGAKKDGKSPNLVRRGFNDGTFDGDPECVQHQRPVGRPDRPGCADGVAAGLREHGGRRAGRLGPRRHDAHVHPRPISTSTGTADYWLENIPALLTAHYNQVTKSCASRATRDSQLQWLGGLYAYQVTQQRRLHPFRRRPFPLSQISRNRLEGYAAFGEATYSLTDTVRSTAGGRSAGTSAKARARPRSARRISADEDYDNVDWKLGVEADLGEGRSSACFPARLAEWLARHANPAEHRVRPRR